MNFFSVWVSHTADGFICFFFHENTAECRGIECFHPLDNSIFEMRRNERIVYLCNSKQQTELVTLFDYVWKFSESNRLNEI